MMKIVPLLFSIAMAFFLTCCANDTADKNKTIAPDTSDLPSDVATRYSYLRKEIGDSKNMTPEEFSAKYGVRFRDSLGHLPLKTEVLDLIQNSELAMGEEELSLLNTNGFAISENHAYETFYHGYEAIYKADLPVYVSADSILDAIHRSYDKILWTVEERVLIDEVTFLLDRMRKNLAAADSNAIGAQTRKDLDFYLTIAMGLLSGTPSSPVAGADPKTVEKILALAYAANGVDNVDFLGVSRNMDFSQFEPRGHYTDSERMGQYFRSMTWFGRVDFRLVETQSDGSRVLNRRQVEAMLALRDLIKDVEMASWNRINTVIETFVGQSDNMVLSEIEALLKDLGISGLSGFDALSDDTIQKAILQGGYGTQQIASHIMKNGLGEETLPLNSSFLLFGQRYVVDSHVFSNLVYDRVQGGKVYRMMPNPLDAAFAALGNDQAAALLGDELQRYPYAPDLHMMRVLVDEYDTNYWKSNLYTQWMSAIRVLSPVKDVADAMNNGLPSTMGTEAWGRRLLNAQLASWSQLRHDTLLYAKQSYTGWPVCEFPDAYIDPYPEFFAALIDFAEKGKTVSDQVRTATNTSLADQIRDYFTLLSAVTTTLKEMAEQELKRIPFTEKQLAFINDAVVTKSKGMGCTTVDVPSGWYTQLFFDPEECMKYDPVIADVHTQPADEGGNEVGRILHVATGKPRLMVVAIETDTGPYAYVGPVFSYFEKITEKWKRYTDEEWAKQLSTTTPSDVPWMNDLVVR